MALQTAFYGFSAKWRTRLAASRLQHPRLSLIKALSFTRLTGRITALAAPHVVVGAKKHLHFLLLSAVFTQKDADLLLSISHHLPPRQTSPVVVFASGLCCSLLYAYLPFYAIFLQHTRRHIRLLFFRRPTFSQMLMLRFSGEKAARLPHCSSANDAYG